MVFSKIHGQQKLLPLDPQSGYAVFVPTLTEVFIIDNSILFS